MFARFSAGRRGPLGRGGQWIRECGMGGDGLQAIVDGPEVAVVPLRDARESPTEA
jgi:hypothetical protein